MRVSEALHLARHRGIATNLTTGDIGSASDTDEIVAEGITPLYNRHFS